MPYIDNLPTSHRDKRVCGYHTDIKIMSGNDGLGHAANKSPFLRLPMEIQLVILQYLQHPADLLNLGRTCRSLYELTRSDDVWRVKVEEIVYKHIRKHHQHASSCTSSSTPWHARDTNVYINYVDRLLGIGTRYLGECIPRFDEGFREYTS